MGSKGSPVSGSVLPAWRKHNWAIPSLLFARLMQLVTLRMLCSVTKVSIHIFSQYFTEYRRKDMFFMKFHSILFKSLFNFWLCINWGGYTHMCVGACRGQRSIWSPGAVVMKGCKPPAWVYWNQIQVLCRKAIQLLSHCQLLKPFFRTSDQRIFEQTPY